jgi:adenylate kinase family enzyme
VNTEIEEYCQTIRSEASSLTRITVVGVSGSGKTSYASKLARGLGIPHIELDSLHWEPGWRPAPLEIFRQRVMEATSAPAWTLDGNYSKVRDIVWSRAQLAIWLDYSLPIIMSRIIRRTFWRVVFQQQLWNNNRETLKGVFEKDSIIAWSFSTYFRRKKEYPMLFAMPEHSHLSVVRLYSPKQADKWLEKYLDSCKLAVQGQGG